MGSSATADGFHGLELFASRVPWRAAVRHPRLQHIHVSFTKNNGSSSSHLRVLHSFANNGYEIFMSQQM